MGKEKVHVLFSLSSAAGKVVRKHQRGQVHLPSPRQQRPDQPRRTDEEQEARLSYPEITEHTPGSLVSSARDGDESKISA